jgi:hypothetical protein
LASVSGIHQRVPGASGLQTLAGKTRRREASEEKFKAIQKTER